MRRPPLHRLPRTGFPDYWRLNFNHYGMPIAAFHRQPERFVFLPIWVGLMTAWDNVTDPGPVCP